ncbi:UNVERIFIED_CONTAM: Cellulose synthase-like protein D5 [Sesamum angustifolium]|uniref:Cellulose synthase-like protein D5 n=1 Tax=Sesamum angustifolium TaxID=2727405 RepID=A0AAW2QUN9_9LAMI
MAAKSPTSSPVKITVTSSGGSRSMGLTSPVPRHSVSNNPNSPSPLSGGEKRRASSSGGGRYLSFSKDSADEFVAYTVHIPPTPDNRVFSDSQNSPPLESSKSRGKNPNEGFIKDTIFTGGFNSATKAHVRKSSEEEPVMAKSKLICGMEGCDEKALDGKFKNYCECGFGICHDCYLDCVGNGGGHCPGCKEPYKDITDGKSEEEPRSEEKDQANPLPSWGRELSWRRISHWCSLSRIRTMTLIILDGCLRLRGLTDMGTLCGREMVMSSEEGQRDMRTLQILVTEGTSH